MASPSLYRSPIMQGQPGRPGLTQGQPGMGGGILAAALDRLRGGPTPGRTVAMDPGTIGSGIGGMRPTMDPGARGGNSAGGGMPTIGGIIPRLPIGPRLPGPGSPFAPGWEGAGPTIQGIAPGGAFQPFPGGPRPIPPIAQRPTGAVPVNAPRPVIKPAAAPVARRLPKGVTVNGRSY